MHDSSLRVRFAPSPTGYLHVGGARTVLYNWLLARRYGGTFILRIEDTDRERHVEDSVAKILSDLRWLGLAWDEGPEVGGPCGPYFQSQRLDLYRHYADRLLTEGRAYYAFETPEELEAMRAEARRNKTSYQYRRPDPLPTREQGLAAKAEGRPVVVRLKMPGRDITVHDDILGDVTLAADQMEDFVIIKSDGWPTYHFACVVDDELMRITHVIRGQEHLMNTPKHIALQWALGFNTPRYAHLPLIFNLDGSKMSKRDKEKAVQQGRRPPEIDVHDFRVSGYLPEALLNFLALVGWSSGDDREMFSLDELTREFSLDRVVKTNARFDREKLVAFNTQWSARLDSDRLLEVFKDYLAVNGSPMLRLSDDKLRRIAESRRGFRTLRDVEDATRFLVIADDAVEYAPDAVRKVLEKNEGAGFLTLRTLLDRLQTQTDWSADALHALIEAFCAERSQKMGDVAQPLRVAITGTTISPAIHESLSLLGRDGTLARIRRCMALASPHQKAEDGMQKS